MASGAPARLGNVNTVWAGLIAGLGGVLLSQLGTLLINYREGKREAEKLRFQRVEARYAERRDAYSAFLAAAQKELDADLDYIQTHMVSAAEAGVLENYDFPELRKTYATVELLGSRAAADLADEYRQEVMRFILVEETILTDSSPEPTPMERLERKRRAFLDAARADLGSDTQ